MAALYQFKEIRENILKNSIANRILLGLISEKEPFWVASALLKVRDETKAEYKKEGRTKRPPNYALYDILIDIRDGHWSLGIQLLPHPIIWVQRGNAFRTIREIVEYIYKTYSINAAKSDKIFSSLPKEVKWFLEDNGYPSKVWTSGIGKKTNPTPHDEVHNGEVESYLKALTVRNMEYRAFVRILLQVLRCGKSYDESDLGSISVQLSEYKDKLAVYFYSSLDCNTYKDCLPIELFCPTMWNTVKSDIDKNIFVGIVK